MNAQTPIQADVNTLVAEAGALLMRAAEQLGMPVRVTAQIVDPIFAEPRFFATVGDRAGAHGAGSSADTALCEALERHDDAVKREAHRAAIEAEIERRMAA